MIGQQVWRSLLRLNAVGNHTAKYKKNNNKDDDTMQIYARNFVIGKWFFFYKKRTKEKIVFFVWLRLLSETSLPKAWLSG